MVDEIWVSQGYLFWQVLRGPLPVLSGPRRVMGASCEQREASPASTGFSLSVPTDL